MSNKNHMHDLTQKENHMHDCLVTYIKNEKLIQYF